MNNVVEYKCPCCGGAINFDSNIQKMKCPFCDTEFEMDALRAQELAASANAPDQMEWDTSGNGEWDAEDMKVYICNSCGGEIVADENTAATSCPFCQNPVTLSGRLSGMLKPDYVIPFKVDKKAAKEALRSHYSGKPLLPDFFKDENHIDEIKGIYVPFWMFGADSDADIEYAATRTRHWSDKDYFYTETQHYQAIRSGSVSFYNIPVDGSEKMADDLMESIEPYNFEEAVDFQSAYLAGYFADKYDISADDSAERANSRVKSSVESLFRDTVTGYESVLTKSSSVRIHNGTAKYALLPVWLLNTTYKGKRYTFAMNGQTGKFVGDLPVDSGKYWKRWGIIAGVLEAAAIIVGLFMIL